MYLLPDYDLTYEVEEVVGGKRIRWYAATLEGDNTNRSVTTNTMHNNGRVISQTVTVAQPNGKVNTTTTIGGKLLP